ncbi:MAG: redox-sensing transcriptional repressor Rex [Candidatus Marinimicrobia bacterium]|nr:redox-sensing transcriptional repressor Rex [Candidatus Neomarinimicrobiota bacterium]
MKNFQEKISEVVIRRLTDYLRCLNYVKGEGQTLIKSSDISIECGLKSSIIRKDLSRFGIIGMKGRGYDVDELIKAIEKILGLDKTKNVVLVGAGNLGTAIIKYQGIKNANFDFVAVFDNNSDKIGKMIDKTKILSSEKLNNFIKENKIEIVLLTVPASETMKIVDSLDSKFVKGILNFTSIILPPKKNNIFIHNIDLAKELEVVSYCMKNCLS